MAAQALDGPLASHFPKLPEPAEPHLARQMARRTLPRALVRNGASCAEMCSLINARWRMICPLNAHQRQEALARIDAGETLADIAKTFRVNATTIGRLKN